MRPAARAQCRAAYGSSQGLPRTHSFARLRTKNACHRSDPLPSLSCRRSRRARKGSAAAMPPKKVVEEETGCARFGCALPALLCWCASLSRPAAQARAQQLEDGSRGSAQRRQVFAFQLAVRAGLLRGASQPPRALFPCKPLRSVSHAPRSRRRTVRPSRTAGALIRAPGRRAAGQWLSALPPSSRLCAALTHAAQILSARSSPTRADALCPTRDTTGSAVRAPDSALPSTAPQRRP